MSRQILTGSLLLSALCFSACSSGGSSDQTGGGAVVAAEGALLVVDGAAGSDQLVSGQLTIVALERADGSLTPNLLRTPETVRVADPRGNSCGVALAPPPAGEYVALHLAWEPGTISAEAPDGTITTCETATTGQRIAFEASTIVGPAVQPWFVLAHDGPISLAPTPGGTLWRPRWTLGQGEPHLVEEIDVEIASVDVAQQTAVGVIRVFSELMVELDFSTAVDLAWEDESELDIAEFLGRLRAGHEIEVDGFLTSWHSIQVLRAEVEDEDGPTAGRDGMSEVLATVLEVRPDVRPNGRVTVRVQSIERGGSGLVRQRPLDVEVVFDGHTQVKLPQQRDRTPGGPRGNNRRMGTILDLEPRQRVEVRWRPGQVIGHNQVVGHRVEIVRNASPLPGPGEILDPPERAAGLLRRVDPVGTGFTLTRRDGGEVPVDISASTIVIAETPHGGFEHVPATALQNVQPAVVAGRTQAGTFAAAWVFVRIAR